MTVFIGLWKSSPHTLLSSYKKRHTFSFSVNLEASGWDLLNTAAEKQRPPRAVQDQSSRSCWLGSPRQWHKKNVLLNFSPRNCGVFFFHLSLIHRKKNKNRSPNAKVPKAFFIHIFLYYDNIPFIICQKLRAVGQTWGAQLCRQRGAAAFWPKRHT